MGFIADIFRFIAETLHKIITAIADAVKWIGQQIKKFFDGIGKWIVLGAFLLMFFAPGLMGAMLLMVKNIVVNIGLTVWNLGKWAVTKVITTIGWLKGTFASFLEAIHFQELLLMHKMGMILSKDYREMMNKVYKEISEFSYQVFGTTEMLHLLLQGSRQLIYSVSSGVGYPVDIAELEWIQTMDETLAKISERAEAYSDNPELIFDDIAEWVYTPIGDKYSSINQGFVLALQGVINGVGGLAEKVFIINNQTQEIVSFLPQPIRQTLMATLAPIDRRITTLQYDIYEPKMAQLDAVLTETNNNVYRNKTEMSSLTQRLIRPADYLGELDDLDVDDRDREKRKINISLNEPADKDIEELDRGVDEQIKIDIDKKEIIPEPTMPPPDFMELEPTEKKIPVARQRTGWSVGDY